MYSLIKVIWYRYRSGQARNCVNEKDIQKLGIFLVAITDTGLCFTAKNQQYPK